MVILITFIPFRLQECRQRPHPEFGDAFALVGGSLRRKLCRIKSERVGLLLQKGNRRRQKDLQFAGC
jgi:hypothetical protein